MRFPVFYFIFFSVLTWRRFSIEMLKCKDRKRLLHQVCDGEHWEPLARPLEYFCSYAERKKENTLNSTYPNDMFRASPISPSLSGLIICTQIGDALLLMILTPFASWTINEEPQVPFLVPRLTWRPVILLHHTDLYIF